MKFGAVPLPSGKQSMQIPASRGFCLPTQPLAVHPDQARSRAARHVVITQRAMDRAFKPARLQTLWPGQQGQGTVVLRLALVHMQTQGCGQQPTGVLCAVRAGGTTVARAGGRPATWCSAPAQSPGAHSNAPAIGVGCRRGARHLAADSCSHRPVAGSAGNAGADTARGPAGSPSTARQSGQRTCRNMGPMVHWPRASRPGHRR